MKTKTEIEITEEILALISKIKSRIDDYESAHCYEDILRDQFIHYVADRGGSLGKLAKLVLTTDDIPFQRRHS